MARRQRIAHHTIREAHALRLRLGHVIHEWLSANFFPVTREFSGTLGLARPAIWQPRTDGSGQSFAAGSRNNVHAACCIVGIIHAMACSTNWGSLHRWRPGETTMTRGNVGRNSVRSWASCLLPLVVFVTLTLTGCPMSTMPAESPMPRGDRAGRAGRDDRGARRCSVRGQGELHGNGRAGPGGGPGGNRAGDRVRRRRGSRPIPADGDHRSRDSLRDAEADGR